VAELPLWQLAAGFLAAIFALMAVAGFLRYPRPLMVVVIALLLRIPIAGLAGYALIPGPPPHPGALLWLAFVPAVAGLAAGVWMLAWMSMRRASLTFANLELLSNGTLISYGGLILAISDALALWQPVWAMANLCVNAAWVLLWLPRRMRISVLDSSVEIAAPLSRVYSYVADPSNWPAYQEDVVSVAVQPEGPVGVGSEVTVTQRYESGVRGPRMLPDTITTVSVVDEVIADRALSMHLAERPAARSRMEFAETPAGTRITSKASAVAPFRLAVFGGLVELRTQRGARLARARRNLERLKRLLEAG
jgi:hypothetical protein